MIRDWRRAWGQGDMPFLVMQLSRCKYNGLYPLIRESQMQALALTNTALVVTADVGMVGDVHYPDKQTVGHRVYLAAQKVAYGQNVQASGPVLRQMTADHGALRLWFSQVDSGLVVKPAPVPVFELLTPQTPPELTADGKAIAFIQPTPEAVARALVIAGDDGIFYPAELTVEGSTLLARSAQVPHPTQVCYAWDDKTPAIVLWNGAGLPASPFRKALDPGVEPACPDASNYTAK
jgi:sialate O-acetylesterase